MKDEGEDYCTSGDNYVDTSLTACEVCVCVNVALHNVSTVTRTCATCSLQGHPASTTHIARKRASV